MKNKYYKKFKRKCPSCGTADKVIIKCKKCLKYCCNKCSIDIICLDCYSDINKINEIEIYFEEKSGVKINE